MRQYHDLLRHILDNGTWKEQRAVLASTGTRPRALAVFGYQCRYDLSGGPVIQRGKQLTVEEVIAAYLGRARQKYGEGTSQYRRVRTCMGVVRQLYGTQPAAPSGAFPLAPHKGHVSEMGMGDPASGQSDWPLMSRTLCS